MINECKWERVTMDFVFEMCVTSKKKELIWVIVDKLTKLTYFISGKNWLFAWKVTWGICVFEIIRLHGVPIFIIFDRDSRFISSFWSKLHETLGTKLNFSTSFHPQIDGQSKRLIQILENMLLCYILEFEGNWEIFFVGRILL